LWRQLDVTINQPSYCSPISAHNFSIPHLRLQIHLFLLQPFEPARISVEKSFSGFFWRLELFSAFSM
jgi:hypothetical protein